MAGGTHATTADHQSRKREIDQGTEDGEEGGGGGLARETRVVCLEIMT